MGFKNIMKWDPYVDSERFSWSSSVPPEVIFIGTRHLSIIELTRAWVPKGSIIIDPFRFIPDVPGSQVIRVGE